MNLILFIFFHLIRLQTFNDLWALDLITWQWSLISNYTLIYNSTLSTTYPTPRYSHSAVVWENKMIIYGGVAVWPTLFADDLWTFDFSMFIF